MDHVVIDAGLCLLRPWEERDVEPLVEIADDYEVARYLRDRFPHPYTIDDAQAWVAFNLSDSAPELHYAIEVDGELAGSIGVERYEGERRGTMHIGYWLGRRFHGRGIATAAVRALTEYIFANTETRRIEAEVYLPNKASVLVLERCGYLREGLMRSAIIKGSDVYDAYLYARIRE